jgi:hypothetical protein
MRVSRKRPSWLRLSLDLWQAGLEAQQVIGLRLAMLMSGNEAAPAELSRMVPEKIAAALEAQQAAANAVLTGNAASIPSRTITFYRRKMRANRKRLSGVKSPSASLTGRRSKRRPR